MKNEEFLRENRFFESGTERPCFGNVKEIKYAPENFNKFCRDFFRFYASETYMFRKKG